MIFEFFRQIQSGRDFTSALIWLAGYLIAIVIGITLHEFAHAFVAYRLGDLTPLYNGRVTINPRAHFDPIGTILILTLGVGYGRPVGFNPNNLRVERRLGIALVSLAGPITNIIIAVVFGLALRFLFVIWERTPSQPLIIVISIFLTIVTLNIGLALFNMLPIPPLDGSKVLLAVLPPNLAARLEGFYVQYQQYAMFAILAFALLLGSQIGALLAAPSALLFDIIVGPLPF